MTAELVDTRGTKVKDLPIGTDGSVNVGGIAPGDYTVRVEVPVGFDNPPAQPTTVTAG